MAGMKFAMGADVLSHLTKKTSTSSDDLGSLVKQLFEAAAPLEGKFNGAGRAAFDRFKTETDGIATELNSALNAVLTGIQGQDLAFAQGDQELADQTSTAQSGSSFDAARFGSRA
ncbi:MAG: hypothetical protein JWP54_669 [Cryobacterium sp.]|jgi:uncharacterized protein YukE|nr:hypothetical protein [Cryobacterium sp.]